MKTQHTPGPWNLNCLETVRHTIHAHRGHVATVARGTMNEVAPDEIEANARLIAAAPDLLEKLAALADYLDEVDVQNSLACGPAGLERAAALQFIARHAIAKATGGTQ